MHGGQISRTEFQNRNWQSVPRGLGKGGCGQRTVALMIHRVSESSWLVCLPFYQPQAWNGQRVGEDLKQWPGLSSRGYLVVGSRG